MSADRVARIARNTLLASVLLGLWFIVSVAWPAENPSTTLVEAVPDREGTPIPVTTLVTQGSVVPVGDENLAAVVGLHVWSTQVEINAAEVEQVEPLDAAKPVEVGPPHSPAAEPTTPEPQVEVELAEPVTVEANVWDRIAQCESGGNWHINTGNGHYGGLQFTAQSWRGVGGTGLPHEHTREEQIVRAEKLLAVQGWGAWPGCSRQAGLR